MLFRSVDAVSTLQKILVGGQELELLNLLDYLGQAVAVVEEVLDAPVVGGTLLGQGSSGMEALELALMQVLEDDENNAWVLDELD